MGLLRLILAISVVLGHVAGCTYSMTGGTASVQSFYIISGFFIALILDLKYTRRDQTRLFYWNRILRIFSTYWLFLLLTVALHLGAQVTTHHRSMFQIWRDGFTQVGGVGTAFLGFTNVAIFGQDWLLFLAPGHHGLHWGADFANWRPKLEGFMFIPPAWSLGVELCFYLLAPWILRRKTLVLTGLFISTLLLRYALWQIGLRADPWSYRFFPTELGMFLFGALSYRLIYRPIRNQRLRPGWKIFALGIFPAIVLYPLYDHSQGLFFTPTQLLFYLYVGVSVPILFRMTGSHPLDRQLGELSYPLYLCHYLIVSMVGHFSESLTGGVFVRAGLALGLSLFVAFLTAIFFDARIDRFRQSLIDQKHRGGQAPPPTMAGQLKLFTARTKT